MGLNYQENKDSVGLIKNEKNHELVGDFEDYGLSGGTGEMVRQLLQSTDTKLDDVFIITSESDLSPNADNDKFPKLNEAVSRRELLLSMLTGKPYPTYILDLVRNYQRDTYTTKIVEAPQKMKEDYQKKMSENREKTYDSEDLSLDRKRYLKFGYTFSSDKEYGANSAELMEDGIYLTPRELLRAGLDYREFLEPEEKKGLLTQIREGIKHRRNDHDNQ